MAARLSSHYSLRFKNENGRVAHELLIDLAEFDKTAGLKVADFAKRLQVCFLYLRRAYLIYIGRITGSTPRLVPGQFQHVC